MLDLHKFQVEDQKVKDMTATDESAEEDLRATKRTATIGSSGDVEGSTLQTVVSRKEAEGECSTVDFKSVKMVEANAGNSTIIVIIIESSKLIKLFVSDEPVSINLLYTAFGFFNNWSEVIIHRRQFYW